MSDKFNKMIELFIAEETDKARELFHEIVVEKSRDIYESLLDEDEVEESEEDLEESDFDEDLGGDAADDLISDVKEVEADEEGMTFEDEDEDEDLEARVDDLADAFAELEAEFEKIMAGEDGDDEMDMDMDDEGEMDMDMDDEEEVTAESAGDDWQPAYDDSNWQWRPADSSESVPYGAGKYSEAAIEIKSPSGEVKFLDGFTYFDEDTAFSSEELEEYFNDPSAESVASESVVREYTEKHGGDTYDKFAPGGDNGANAKSPVTAKGKLAAEGGKPVKMGGDSSEKGMTPAKPKAQTDAMDPRAAGKAGMKKA